MASVVSSGRKDNRHQYPRLALTTTDRNVILIPTLLPTWDDAIEAYLAEGNDSAGAGTTREPSLDVETERQESAVAASLMAGIAITLWSSWEVRSRLDDRRIRRPYLKA